LILLEITTSKGKHSFDGKKDVAFMLEALIEKLKEKHDAESVISGLSSIWYFMGEKIEEIKVIFDENYPAGWKISKVEEEKK